LRDLAKTRGHCPYLDGYVPGDTSPHPYTHIIDSREVLYRWHPWYGQRVWIHARFVKDGVATFRCGLEESPNGRSSHLPQWMFDAIACSDLRLAASPGVSCEALSALRMLIERRRTAHASALEHAGHLDPSLTGDADAKLAKNHTACAFLPAEPLPQLGEPSRADQEAADSTARPTDARASRQGRRKRTAQGGRR